MFIELPLYIQNTQGCYDLGMLKHILTGMLLQLSIKHTAFFVLYMIYSHLSKIQQVFIILSTHILVIFIKLINVCPFNPRLCVLLI